jgi:hypothetical protein
MSDDQSKFLALVGQPPARLTAEQTAWMLNCQPYDIPVLVAQKLLKPLGVPAQNGHKYFSFDEVREQMRDRSWLSRVTNALQHYWRNRNGSRNSSRVLALDETAECLAEAGMRDRHQKTKQNPS